MHSMTRPSSARKYSLNTRIFAVKLKTKTRKMIAPCQSPPSHPVAFPELLAHDHHGGLVGAEAEDSKKIYNEEVVLRDNAVSCKAHNENRDSGDELLVV